jgi:hypothetical protein
MNFEERIKVNKSVPSDIQAVCKNCIFWRDDESDDITDTGFCHRFPPVLCHGRALEHDKYPRTTIHDWCGEYIDKF